MSNPHIDLSVELSRDESKSQRFARKSRESPAMVIGLTGCTLAVIYGAYRFKHRGNLSASNYLMQLRVGAQGTVIGCLTVAVCYSLFSKFIGKKDEP